MTSGLRQAAEFYFSEGTALAVSPLGEGHIHDSYVVRAGLREPPRRLVLQRINRSVFPDPQVLVRNVAHVTEHLCRKALASGRDAERAVLRLVPARDGEFFVTDSSGDVWRAFVMIERAAPVSYPESPVTARAMGEAFGRFLLDLSDFPADAIEPALPWLHEGDRHLGAMDDVARRDPQRRLSGVTDELALINAVRGVTCASFARLPQRVIHGDTKINNVLLDVDTGKGLCVIDLDTVMVGASVIDIGNFLRSVLRRSRAVGRESPNWGIAFFEAGLRGYRAGMGRLLVEAEWVAVLDAVLATAATLAARFLADYLAGDRYFRVVEPDDNLKRCREQLAVVSWVETHESELRGVVHRIAESAGS